MGMLGLCPSAKEIEVHGLKNHPLPLPLAWSLFFFLALALPPLCPAQQVAITFDDLPAHGPLPAGVAREEVTRKILAAFKEAKVPEVYGFINAGKLQTHPEDIKVLQLWREAGQPLANHTYDHISLNGNPLSAFEENVAKDEATLQELMGKNDWHWFRYPYLDEGDTLEKRRAARAYLKDRGYRIAQVSLDFEDYAWNGPYVRCSEKKDEKAIVWLKKSYLNTATEYMNLGQQLSQQLFGRNIKHILLMHVGAFDAEMLPQLLAQMKQQGFKFITLKEAESDPVYEIDPDIVRKEGSPVLEQIMDARHLPLPPHAEKPMKELQEVCRH
jgi:peptidoglycan/xylan/chitin deacetylase (PgdA/CDA1 family)